MKEKRVKAGQIELQIRDYEHPGDAIIFLHFSGANLMMWQRIVPYFQDHYRLILVDLRGHGKSDKPATGYHMDEMARDVIGVMQHLGLERAHIVGSSLGAEVGLSLAANYPAKVISFVNDGALSSEYGPYSTWEGSQADFQAHVAAQLEKMHAAPEKVYPSLDAMVAANRENLEKYGYWNEYMEAVVRYGALKLDDGQYTRGFRKQAMETYMKHYFTYRLEDYYAKVQCPLMMLTGAEALENEPEKAVMEGLRALAAQAKIVALNGWDHPYGWLLTPEEVSKAVLKFLGGAAS